MSNNTSCKICGAIITDSNIISVKEMQLGTRENFKYGLCDSCGGLSLMEDLSVMDLSSYYPSEQYYSVSAKNRSILSKLASGIGRLGKHILHNFLGMDKLSYKDLLSQASKTLYGIYGSDAQVLDIGCGSGSFLKTLSSIGFENLDGIEPHLKSEIQNNLYSIKKMGILDGDRNKTYDLIFMNHVIEHIPDHHSLLKKIYSGLNKNGRFVVSQPIVNLAFDKYREHRYQIDSPRHIIIHSLKSFKNILAEHGFEIEKEIFNSHFGQFYFSELYSSGIGLNEIDKGFKVGVPLRYHQWSKILNEKKLGDQATFIIKKIS